MSGIIKETDQGYRLEFKYAPWLVEAIKAIPGRRYWPADRSWTIPKPAPIDLGAFARKHNLTFKAEQAPEVLRDLPDMPELTIDIPLKAGAMRHYQKQGVAYGMQKMRYICGDEPGLGKTLTTIATIEALGLHPALIVCPATLKLNWKREIEQWTNRKAIILSDRCKSNYHLYHQAGMADYFIVNYESLKKYFVEKVERPADGKPLRLNHIKFKAHIAAFKALVGDESHRLKDTKTLQAKFMKGIAKDKEFIALLTGTPVINKPKDLISQLGIINRMPDFGGYSRFVERYCGGTREASNLKELNLRLNETCFFRREKRTVLTELPDKMRRVVYTEIDTRKEYEDALADLERYLKEYKGASDAQVANSMRGKVMVEIGILKNISARGKLDGVCEFIDDMQQSGQKLVVFAHLKEIIQRLKAKYPTAVSITGDDSMEMRQHAIDRFQNNENQRLIICSTMAAGVGITLTAASNVAFVELPWTAAACEQAEDRCHRLGQKDSVTATYFLGEDTIDKHIYNIITTKRGIAQEITGDEASVQEEVINELWKVLNKPLNS